MSVPRRSDLVHDLLEIAQEIEGYVQRWGQKEFMADRAKQRVFERTLELLGEVANQLGDDVPDIESVNWKGLRDLRIILAHLYDRVEAKRLWEEATTSVPALRHAVQEWVDAGNLDH